jgi:hypothetical protein
LFCESSDSKGLDYPKGSSTGQLYEKEFGLLIGSQAKPLIMLHFVGCHGSKDGSFSPDFLNE